MKNIEEKTESKLKKIVKNLDVLVPFKCFPCNKKWSERKGNINGIFSSLYLTALISYLGFAVHYGEFNPLRYGEALTNENLMKQREVYQTERNGWHYDLNANLPTNTAKFEDYCNKK